MQDKENNLTQGEKIAFLRKKHGMTQADLGTMLNVSYQAVSKWEREESYPDFDTISRISKIFRVPIQFFEQGVGSEVLKESAPARVAMPERQKAEPKLVGLCKQCGKAVYEGDDARTNAGVVCKSCFQRTREEEARKVRQREEKKEQFDRRVRWRRNAGLIVGAIVAVLSCVICVCSGEVVAGLTLLLFGFTYTSQMFWNGAVQNCTLAGGHIIGEPGLIFTFDLDGVIWLIGMKILFALLRFAVWLLTVLVCALAALLISPFTFIPALLRVNRGEMEFDDLESVEKSDDK